ncbi:MAG: indolepyruvate oxidoreductase subunit beta [Candidatus Bathyarchaeota archaeon]|nr:indolepyruvate oxidoreductase subunit beta [Candidatus Bathyarchaeota archaeon]
MRDTEHNILITSVGGQGGVTLAKVLAHAALIQGLDVMVGETLGMAQRGGSVQSHIRVGEGAYGSLIPKGRCNFLLSLEPSEAVRVPEYLSPSTIVILSTTPVYPIPVMLKEAIYPELTQIILALEKIGCKVYTLEARGLASEANAPASLNIVILGAYAALSGLITVDSMRKALYEALSKRFLEANMRAFDKGYYAMKKLL